MFTCKLNDYELKKKKKDDEGEVVNYSKLQVL
jgi:hypothetical protein